MVQRSSSGKRQLATHTPFCLTVLASQVLPTNLQQISAKDAILQAASPTANSATGADGGRGKLMLGKETGAKSQQTAASSVSLEASSDNAALDGDKGVKNQLAHTSVNVTVSCNGDKIENANVIQAKVAQVCLLPFLLLASSCCP